MNGFYLCAPLLICAFVLIGYMNIAPFPPKTELSILASLTEFESHLFSHVNRSNMFLRKVTLPYEKSIYVSSHFDSFWTLVEKKKWGDHLFEFLRKILLATPKPIYIGFGEWIGPTFLFATFFSDAAFGLEPQPDAYRVLFENTNVNRKVFGAHKIIVTSRLCIQHAPVSATRFWNATFVGKGDSMSRDVSLKDRDPFAKNTSYLVTCTSLEMYLKHFVLPLVSRDSELKQLGRRLVIKVDIEGGEEAFLSNPLLEWIKRDFLPFKKPTFVISIHAGAFRTQKSIDKAMEFIHLFRYCSRYDEWTEGSSITYELKKTNQINAEDVCFKGDVYCDVVLTDFKY